MKLKSRGLGRKELVMDFREYTVVREGRELLILGTIHEPVHWDFSIRLCEDDLPGIVRVALQRRMLGWLLRALLRRTRHAHWSQDRATHLAEAQARRAAAAERSAAAARPPAEDLRGEGTRG
jgi:hypothetical protein